MKRLTKRLAQLEAKLRFMSSQKSFSKSKMFGVVQQILAVEAAIAELSSQQEDVSEDKSMKVNDLVSNVSAKGKNGRVVAINGDKAQVQWSTRKTWVKIENLVVREAA